MAPTTDMIQPAVVRSCPAENSAELSANKRASDAEQNRDDKTTRIFPRHQQLRNCANDKTDTEGSIE